MEILHFCPSRSYSGLEQYAFSLANYQAQQGKQVGFVVAPGSRLQEECTRHKIPTVVFNPFAKWADFIFASEFLQVLQEHRNLKTLHLHSTQELGHVFVPLLMNNFKSWGERKFKVILQTHLWINHRKKDPWHWLQYRLVDEVWCSSQSARESLVQRLPVGKEKIRVVPYGRPVQAMTHDFLTRQEARKELGVMSQGVVVGTVSRIEPSKGIRELIEAFISLGKRNNELELAIIGGPSPMDDSAARYHSELQALTQSAPPLVAKRIHWLGNRAHSYRFLKAFDLYVLPSHQETFSLSLLDALAAQLPVVATQSGGTPDVVIENETGWLAIPKDSKSLEIKMEQALRHQGRWSEIGANGAQLVLNHYDQANIFPEIMKYYGESHQQ
ncbi:MAG: glycosyltransferase family 4 protein [Oligoflexia bacterium]|nr:glycosyltransferase family 4 protein [Oligoflexia bacterium]